MFSCVDPKRRGPSPRRVLTRNAADPCGNLWSRRVNRHTQARVRYVRPRGRARRGAFGAAGRRQVLRRACGHSSACQGVGPRGMGLSADSPEIFRTDRPTPRPARRLENAPVTAICTGRTPPGKEPGRGSAVRWRSPSRRLKWSSASSPHLTKPCCRGPGVCASRRLHRGPSSNRSS
jgi:hypothetical protein